MTKSPPSIGKIGMVTVASFLEVLLLFLAFQFNTRKSVFPPPPPTLPIAKTTMSSIIANTLSFPAFHLSLQVPSELKTRKQVDPGSEDTQIGANYMALYTPNAVIDTHTHKQTSGAVISIKIDDTKKAFTDKQAIVPTTSMNQATSDTSIVPLHNSFVNSTNTRSYSFPSSTTSKAWVNTTETLLRAGGKDLDVTLTCLDYSSTKPSEMCQNLIKGILSTIKQG